MLILWVFLSLTVGLCAFSLILLRTEPGQRMLERGINRLLENPQGLSVRIQGLGGALPFDLHMENLSLHDREGLFLQVRHPEISLSPGELLSGRIHIQKLRASYLGLYRLPLTNKKSAEKHDKEEKTASFPPDLPAIHLEELLLEEIFIAESLAGEDMHMRLQAFLHTDRELWQTGLHLDMIRGPEASLALEAGFFPETGLFNIHSRLDEPHGRLSLLLGLDRKLPLHLRLGGESMEENAWKGSLDIRAGENNGLKSEISLSWKSLPTLILDGGFDLDPELLPEPLRGLLPTGHFKAGISRADTGHILISHLLLENSRLALEGEGNLLPETKEMDSRLFLSLTDTKALADWLGFNPGTDISLDISAKGPFTAPETRIRLSLKDPEVTGLSFSLLELDGQLAIEEKKSGLPDLLARGKIRGENFSYTYAPLPDLLEADFDLAFALSSGHLFLNDLSIQGEDVSLEGKGEINTKNLETDIRARLHLGELHPWVSRYLPWEACGSGTLETRMTGSFYPLYLHFDILTELAHVRDLPHPLGPLTGDRAKLEGKLLLDYLNPEDGGMGIHIPSLTLDTPNARLKGQMALFTENGRFETDAHMHLRHASALLPEATGSLDLFAQTLGSFDDLSLTTALEGPDLTITGTPAPFRIDLKARDLFGMPSGIFRLNAGPEDFLISGGSAFHMDEKAVSLSGLLLHVPGGKIKGDAAFDFEKKVILGELKADLEDASPYGTLAGMDMEGRGQLIVHMFEQESRQDASLHLELKPWKTASLALENLRAEGNIQNLFEKPEMHASIRVENLSVTDLRINSAEAGFTGSPERLALDLQSTGHIQAPFELNLAALYEEAQNTRSLTMEDISGSWDSHVFSLVSPVLMQQKEEGFFLESLDLILDSGRLKARAAWQEDSINMQLDLTALPVPLLTPFMEGEVDAAIHMEGDPANPHIRAEVKGRNLVPHGGVNLPVMALDADATLRDKNLSLRLRAGEMHASEPLLQGHGHMPMGLSLAPFHLDISENHPVEASLAGSLDLGRLGLLFMPHDQALTGRALVDLSLNGSVGTPRPSGTILFQEIAYQHLEQGVLIRDLAAALKISEDRIELENFSASDGASGLLQGSGRVLISSEEHFPFQFSVDAERFKVVDNPLIMAVMARGNSTVSGNTQKQEVKGNLRFERVLIQLRDTGGPEVADLNVLEINGKGEPEPVQAEPEKTTDLALDINLHFPSRIFVRGRGLDSEWGGRIAVQGQGSAPVIRGDIRLLRGRMDFLGKRLTLTEGNIMLDGSQPPNPFVTFEARQEGREIVSILRVEGHPPELDFSLSSNPELPQDEVLAHMLFGRSLATITPVQAAQLALAARQLAGHGGPGAIDTARNILQLDDLDIVSDGDDNEDIRLRAGKYIHERVYLRVEKDLKTDDDLVSADVELSRRLTLESRLSPRGGEMGLYWKRDY
ncbi:translocation/assembly module TamB domain-containing protein [Desulfobotulus alkaliphilus]|nr:translocation/assembly module TamB domain-containing protein [Desulfobotulus alkaliphilus]